MEIYEALKKSIEAADKNYEKNKDDSYLSVIYAHKKQKLENILSQLEHVPEPRCLLQELRQELKRLSRLAEEEEHRPTFDWYGEHYWETVYMGEIDGCKEAVSILETFQRPV